MKLEADFQLPAAKHLEVSEGQNVELDFNGHKIIKSDNSSNAPIENYGVMTLNDTSEAKLGGISGENRCINNYNQMTIETGYYSTSNTTGGTAIQNKISDAVMVINDCQVTAGVFAFYNAGIATINDGTFENYGSCSSCNPNGWAYTAKSTGTLYVNGGNIHGVQGALAISAGCAEIKGGNFYAHACALDTHKGDGSRNAFYALYVAGEEDDVKCVVYDGQFTSDGYYSVVLVGNDNTNGDGGINADATSEIKGGTFTATLADTPALKGAPNTGNPIITGGTFSSDVSEYMADSAYNTVNDDGTYTIKESSAVIIDTAKAPGCTVTLDGLKNNTAIDHEADAVYSVEVNSAPAEDKAKIEAEVEKLDGEKPAVVETLDIKVKKTVDGAESYVTDVKEQNVTITLPSNATGQPKVYYIEDGAAKQIEDSNVTWNESAKNIVSFVAPHFSTYSVVYDAEPIDEEDVTESVSVAFEKVTDTEYDIVLKAKTGKKINRFMSTDLTFAYEPDTTAPGNISYTILPAANISLPYQNSGKYELHLDGVNAYGASGTEIPIGKVVFEGYGKGVFKVADADTNIVNTAETADNIVAHYISGGGAGVGTLLTNEEVEDGKGQIDLELTAPTKKLTVNVAFNNSIDNNAKAYQQMKVTVSGGDLSADKVIELGSDNDEVTFDETNKVYTVTLADTLTKNVAYTVTVEGEGYRTARYTVNMTGDKSLNFWNNVKDKAEVVEIGQDNSAVTKNFLAGDIVKDNNINLYDLSAVVSYFGMIDLNTDEDHYQYAKYDLNRDGKIDSKDVAYVLVSWGN